MQLYPYGFGYLDDTVNTLQYIRHTLECGIDRTFQSSSSYIFSRYHYEMRRKFGAVCAIAASKMRDSSVESVDDIIDNKDVTAGEMLSIIAMDTDAHTSAAVNCANNERIGNVLQRLVPFGRSIPGTLPDIKLAKKHVLAMLNSPVILEEAEFTWFSTVAFADQYDPILYSILNYKLPSRSDDFDNDLDKTYNDCFATAAKETFPKRQEELRNHPALSCRVFYLKQIAVLDYILKGSHAPLGKRLLLNLKL